MNTRSIKIIVLMVGVLSTSVLSVDPPFNENLALLGSLRYVEENWAEQIIGTGGDFVRMEGPGMRCIVGPTIGNTSTTQYLRPYTPTQGKIAVARFRVKAEHLPGTEVKFGFFSKLGTAEDPWDEEPAVSAYLYGKRINENDDTLTVYGVTKASSDDDPTLTDALLETNKTDFFNFVIEVVEQSSVLFHYFDPSTQSWQLETVTSPLPDATLYFSMSSRRVGGTEGLNNLTARVFEFEIIDAPE
jgi:hypothetical protein